MRYAVAKRKTSFDYPLVIDRLAVPGYAGLLGLTFCPGKRAPSLLDNSVWERQLSVDIERIVAWGASMLVSLIDTEELVGLGVTELPFCAAQAGLQWQHWPMRDGGIPDVLAEQQWLALGPAIHGALQRGHNVVLHCRGGLGRTGLAAAKVLIEAGVAPSVAMRTVRKARANTIETAAQEAYLLALKPLSSRRP